MTWQSAAVRYISIGERSARFRDLLLPFTLDEEPVESVVWLPNGGGKSSLMSLKSAVVLPASRDFTGAGREDGEKRPRRLDDYVINDDTSHTVIEWTAKTGDLLGTRSRLLTGAVYEWPNRKRPGPDQQVTLNKLWWSAVPLEGVLELDTLPVRGEKLLTLTQFTNRLRALNVEHPELQIEMSTKQSDWETQLGRLGVDTALYRYQARMNTSEGGIAKVFNFNTVRDFVDLVVDVIATPDQAKDCADILTEHAANLFRRPVLQVERQFLTEAAALLTDIDTAHRGVQAAMGQRESARRAAARVRAALSHAATEADLAAAASLHDSEQLIARITDARRERGRLDGLRAELAYLAAEQRHQEAVEEVESSTLAEQQARADRVAWAAAGPLAEAAGHDASAQVLREQLQPERAERAALREQLDVAAAATRDLLLTTAADHGAAAEEARIRGRAHMDRQRGLDAELSNVRRHLAQRQQAAAAARALLEDHDRLVVAARRTGDLTATETPTAALERHRAAAAAAVAKAAEHRAAESEHRAAAAEAGRAATTAAGEHSRLRAETQAAAADEQRLRAQHGLLATDERLLALAEADGHIDVWGDAGRLRHALGDAVRDAGRQALSAAVESADDERLVAGVDSAGFLPAPVATQGAAATLTSAGVVAESAWNVLTRDYSPTQRRDAAALRPDVACAVVVQDSGARTRALALLSSWPVLTHIPVVTSDELAAATGGALPAAALPSVPLHDGLHVTDAARAAADSLRQHGHLRAKHLASLTARADADRALLSALTSFLGSYPDSDSLTLAARLTATTAHAAEAEGAQRAEHERDRDACGELADQARNASWDADRSAAAAARSADTARSLADAADRLTAHRATIAEASADVAAATVRIEKLEADLAETRDQVSAQDQERGQREREAASARASAAGVVFADRSAPRPEDAVAAARARGLTACQASYQQLLSQWQAASSSSVLESQLQEAERRGRDARGRSERILGDYDGDRSPVAELAQRRGASHTSTACESTATAAGRTVDAALVRATDAQRNLQARLTAREEAAEVRSRAPRVTAPVPFTSAGEAEAEAETLGVRVAAQISTETTLTAERDRADEAAVRDSTRADSMRDLADRLPAAVPADTELGDVVAFTGDVKDGRVQVRAALGALDAAGGAVTAAQETRSELARTALQLSGSPAYHNLTLTLRARLMDSDTASLGAKAAGYLGEVNVRLVTVEDLLAQIGADEGRVTMAVSSHIRQLLKGISGAARASKLPPGLGALSGKQFINLRFSDPTDEELAGRVSQETLALLDAAHGSTKSLPSGETVLRRCVHAAVGNKGFKVDVLKPNEHMMEQWVNVTEVARFSDGEKLTTCVLLFCAFSRMRGRGEGATGTLMLDNPFGRASNAQLVALQLAVAKAQQVHLVYATGLEDMGALLQFRRLIRLRNRKPVGTTDGHVQLESSGARSGEVSGVSVARPDAPVPAELVTLSAAAGVGVDS